MAWEQVLNPEVLQTLRGYNYRDSGSYYDPQTQRWYTPEWTQTGMSGQGENATPEYAISGWRGYDSPQSEFGADPSRLNGREYTRYDANGQKAGTGTWSGIEGRSVMDALLPLGMVAAPFAAAMFPAVGSAMSFGANPVLSGASATGAAQAAGAMGAAGAAGGAGAGSAALPGGAGMDVAGFEGLTAADMGASGAGAAGAGAAGGNALTRALPAGAASLIGPALTAGAGIYGAKVAGDAAKTQTQSAQDALGLQRDMFNKLVELQQPWQQAGTAGLDRLMVGLGLKDGAGKGELTRDFSMADYQADPGYQFRQEQGAQALERSAAARGGLLSGRAVKDMARFSQGLASDEYGKAFDRFQVNRANKLNPLQSLAGVGQSVAQNVGNAGMSYGNNAAGLITDAGNARAAGQVGRANAITGAVGQGISQYQNNQLMDLLTRGR